MFFFNELTILKIVCKKATVYYLELILYRNTREYLINQTLKLCWIQIQMDGVYTMVHHTGLNVVS